MPGSRRLMRQLFAFFLNIDHLWLYIYHKREYGYYVDRLLTAVHNLEEEKWNMVETTVLNTSLGVDVERVVDTLDYKLARTAWKYI